MKDMHASFILYCFSLFHFAPFPSKLALFENLSMDKAHWAAGSVMPPEPWGTNKGMVGERDMPTPQAD